jgi:hypothetical protein
MNVEQAIFTSAKTDRAVGYQVVARSPGAHDVDIRELSVWCPSHDSLLTECEDSVSFNFHPLPSGAYCVSRTLPAGWEYSGRGGVRVYTHCLIVPPDVLACFANNPFALLQAALETGAMEIRDPIPARLETLSISGSAPPVDQTLLICLGNRPGPKAMATLVQSAINAACLAVAGEPSPCELIVGLINCLPPSHRLDFSFSTGLKFSGRRPFHLIAMSDDPGEQRWMAHKNNVTAIDLSAGKVLPSVSLDGWARFIERVMSSHKTSFLAGELSKRRTDLKPEDLPALGLQLLEELEACVFSASEPVSDFQLAHAAHRQFQKTQSQTQAVHLAVEAPSASLHADSPEISPENLEKLELLDDLVYDSINGRPGAIEHLQALWPEVREEFGDELLAESREQYLRYALTIWEGCVDNDNIRNPIQAVQALDVLCLLFEE